MTGERRITLSADKGYDTTDFVAECRQLNATPHVAQNTTKRATRIDGRTSRHERYEISQRERKRVEECFGWMFVFTAATYNLVRIRNLVGAT